MFNIFSLTDLIGLVKSDSSDRDKLNAYEKIEQKKLDELFETRGSIMSLLEPYLIEPILFLSSTVKNNSNGKYQDAINDQIDYFTSIYCQAFKILTQVHGIDGQIAVRLLKTTGYGLSPVEYGIDNVKKFLRKEIKQSFESAMCRAERQIREANRSKFLTFDSLSSREDKKKDEEEKDGPKYDDDHESKRSGVNNGDGNAKFSTSKIGDAVDGVGYYYQIRNFSVSIPVDMESVDKKGTKVTIKQVEIPITIKCNVVIVHPEQLINALTSKRDSNTLFNRILSYRAGGISFFELIFATDLISQYAESKRKDKDDIINILNSREFTSYAEAIANGKVRNLSMPVGYERFYNLFCVTEEDFKLFEIPVGGSLDKLVIREKLFNKLNAQQIMVLDTQLETAKLYLQKFPEPCYIPFSKLGKRKSDKRDDLDDLFKALLNRTSSSVPNF